MKMKKTAAIFLAAAMLAAGGSAFAEHNPYLNYGDEWEDYTSVSTRQFSDVPITHWAFEEINRVVAKGWFGGYPDGTFHPNEHISRAEAMTVFMNFLGIQPTPVTSTSYTDVKASSWYAPYIEAGKELFPTKATFNGQTPFLPEQPIIREDVCYALVKAKKYDSQTVMANLSVLNMFRDQSSISADIKPYVAVAVSNGLISGYDDRTIGAQDPLTRAEFAAMLYRASFAGTQ
ncbi:MAG: S-layer homology domain-containing protein [Clostridiales bacterium]|nr:S-layer homology domain-containing protein [Clostridiales bacterium]